MEIAGTIAMAVGELALLVTAYLVFGAATMNEGRTQGQAAGAAVLMLMILVFGAVGLVLIVGGWFTAGSAPWRWFSLELALWTVVAVEVLGLGYVFAYNLRQSSQRPLRAIRQTVKDVNILLVLGCIPLVLAILAHASWPAPWAS